jgi:hypothetical protein
MRNLGPRPELPSGLLDRLQKKTDAIVNTTDSVARRDLARKSYDASRRSAWFSPVVQVLRDLSGDGGLCMYCSSNEPSQIEHYRPLTVFPENAFQYENYLWTCDICNRQFKGERFPPNTEPGDTILNPIDDNVWDHYFLDERFGRLVKRLSPHDLKPFSRAVSTSKIVGVERETVQKKRQHRLRRLRDCVQNAVDRYRKGSMSQSALVAELHELVAEPFQSDVADYFLCGPGKALEPFKTALTLAGKD